MTRQSIKKILVITSDHIVPPTYYGGAQRVIHKLCLIFKKNGIKVNLIAGKGSKKYGGKLYTYSSLNSLFPNSHKNYLIRILNRIHFILGLFLLGRDADLIYSFKVWPEYISPIRLLNKNKIIFHDENTVRATVVERIFKNFRNCKYVTISEDQKKEIPKKFIKNSFVITNPIVGYTKKEIDKTILLRSELNIKDSPLLFIGRLTYDKGVDLAIKLAIETKKKLIILGPVKYEEKGQKVFFEEKIKPFLSNQIDYKGNADDKMKLSYIRKASALIMLNRWRDPCPLTMTECTSMGLPLIGTNKGSLPENIKNGVNGFLGDSMSEWIDSIKRIDKNEINPLECSKYSLKNFSQQKFEDSVFKVINSII